MTSAFTIWVKKVSIRYTDSCSLQTFYVNDNRLGQEVIYVSWK